MRKELILKQLFETIEFNEPKPAISDFKEVFRHISYYEAKGNLKQVGNSRLVYLGMYAFKGTLATILEKYTPGNGKQIQQLLGNIFTNERLAKIFDELQFEILIEYGPNFDANNYKHIFALAYLGFIVKYALSEYTIKKASELFLVKSETKTNTKIAQNNLFILKAKADQVLNEKVKIQYFQEKNEEINQFITKVLLNSGQLIEQHTSKSQLYSKKKAVKLALDFVLEKERVSRAFKNIEARKLAEAERKKNTDKNQIKLKHQQYLEEKRTKRLKIVEEKQKAANEREYNRLLNKKNLKFGDKPKKKVQEFDDSKMSAKKKQRLIDKAK